MKRLRTSNVSCLFSSLQCVDPRQHTGASMYPILSQDAAMLAIDLFIRR